MGAPTYLPFSVDAHMADTQHLSLEEGGAYFKLLLCAWKTDRCELPADDKRIAIMLGVSAGKWAKLKPAIMPFWTRTETGWMQKRLSKERQFVEEKRQKNSAAAEAMWSAKRLKSGDGRDADASAPALPPSLPLSQDRDTTRPTSAGDDDFGKVCAAAGLVPKAGRADGERARLAGWIEKGLDVERDILPAIRRHMTDERHRDDPTTTLKRFEGAIAHALATRSASQPPAPKPSLAEVGDGGDGYRKALPADLLPMAEIRLEGRRPVHIAPSAWAADQLNGERRAALDLAARLAKLEPPIVRLQPAAVA